MMAKPRASFFQIWNMCFGFLGIQIGFGLQNANASRIFQTLGADIDKLAILWIAAPMTGLLVQPIIGHFSDKTWGPLGRRRPYFLAGAILTCAAMFLMPNSPALWIAAGALWMMDASINVTMEPFRAFVGDLLPEDQRTLGFAMQSFFIGIGAVFASALPWMLANWFDVSNQAPAGLTPDSVRLAFYIGGAVLLGAVVWTVATTREPSPEQLAADDEAPPLAEPAADPGRRIAAGLAWAAVGLAAAALVAALDLKPELYVLAGFVAAYGGFQALAGWMRRRGARDNGFLEVVEDIARMPRTMRQLAVVQFFSWFGLFAMWIYATPAVTAVHYGASDTTSAAYNDGADWVGILFAVYNGVAALAAFLIPLAARRLGRRTAHAINLALGGLGLISFWVIREPAMLWIGMVGVGIAWASILSSPYSILAGALPARKMGVYMGIFNFFIVIPQLVAATILGLALQAFFADQAIWALMLGGGSLIVAAAATFAVDDPAGARLARARPAPEAA